MKKFLYILFTFLALISLIFIFETLFKDPQIWPDEASMAWDIYVMIKNNSLQMVSHYPPVIIYILLFLFKVFGVTIEVQRYFSLFTAFLFLIIYYFFIKNFFKNLFGKSILTIISISTIVALICDYTFQKASKVGRTEILVLFFGLTSLIIFTKILENTNKTLKIIYIFSFLLITILNYYTHPISLFFPLSTFFYAVYFYRRSFIKNSKIIIPIAVVVLIFIIAITFSIKNIILIRLNLIKIQGNWIFEVFTSQPFNLKLIYLIYFIFTGWFIIYAFKKKGQMIFLALILIFSWITANLTKQFWYFVFPLPFVYLAGLILATDLYLKKVKNYLNIPLILLIILVFLNILININIVSQIGGDKYSYQKYGKDITDNIPDNSRVFLSSIPDPFYSLLNNRKGIYFYLFPSYLIGTYWYNYNLNDSDYVIYNGTYDYTYNGNFLVRYIEANKQEIKQIGGPDQYSAYIIKLKPKDQRINI